MKPTTTAGAKATEKNAPEKNVVNKSTHGKNRQAGNCMTIFVLTSRFAKGTKPNEMDHYPVRPSPHFCEEAC